jgi:Holliday junction resolvase-like predicted endonuclease
LRAMIGRFEADRIERRAGGSLCLVEVRSRPTIALALASVGRRKRRRLAWMAKRLAAITAEPVTIEVEAAGKDGVARRVVGHVYPDGADQSRVARFRSSSA